ncbi:DgyrCDS5203 [Dimorphilus gyrociliatus]|uniref:Cilia- and flagella-associated protein 206 n=1 Tax=Dimorphilus gyrociliatus TaxID=2664684 RepID=A0A7I8VLU5_9ANNE|nr:DgyrCDS5203 [Dimorphilus gyrociliatus]
MSRAQAESVIKNIIKEIAQECASKGQTVSETLVAFMVKAVVLDPNNEFNVDRTLTKDDVQKLIRICVDHLLDPRSPSLETVKMQVYFDMNYTSRSEFLAEHRRVLESRMVPVTREITDSRARTREELESLYRKIVSAVLLRSGLGSPVDIGVVREATAALQSVFPQTELGTFMSLTKKDKEKQLYELTMIVTGIRLFNKECGKGGEGIDDLPSILNEAIPATTQNVDVEMEQTLNKAYKYEAIIHFVQTEIAEKGTCPIDPSSLKLFKEALINSRQHEAFLRVILHDIISCAKQVESLEGQLAARLESLQTTVQSKTAVPTAHVYPQFIHLSQIWTAFQDEMVHLSVLSNILVSLEPFVRTQREIFSDEVIQPLLENLEVKSDEDRLKDIKKTLAPREFKEYSNIEVLLPDTTNNYSRLPIQYKGFCPVTLSDFDGYVQPGIPEMGLLKYKDRYYCFCSHKNAAKFAENPEQYILECAQAAKRSPELIQLLELHNQFAAIAPYAQGREKTMIEKPIMKTDNGCQTDTHLMESNIVKDYEWNEWELRRKALKLANLRNKATHAQQTNLSNYKRENATQVYPLKENETQTLKDGKSQVPKQQIFLHGLRGCGFSEPSRKTVMTKIDLTTDIDQN